MTSEKLRAPSPLAILTLADITSATDAFNRGEINVFDALDSIITAIAAYQATSLPEGRRHAA
jgi:hypothetical protein